eukprot:COSAG02_NODE_3524_length_6615_cov_6.371393_5_plen_74_part_00
MMLTCQSSWLGVQGVKIDGCGAQRNNTLYAELMQKTGKNYTIEKYATRRFTLFYSRVWMAEYHLSLSFRLIAS